MFTSLSWRPLVLASSCTVAMVAVTLATVPSEGLVERVEARLPQSAPELTAHEMRLPEEGGTPLAAPHPEPGGVAACEEGGSDEVLALDDDGAPGGQRPLWVHRPPGPDSADLPVLYLLHGSASTHVTLMEQGLGPLLDREMCRTGVEFVVAAPHGQESGGAATEWADAADGSFGLESFVTGDAVEAVEGEHGRHRNLRAIGGFSMGGYGAANLALRNTELYTQVASFGGYFGADDPHGVLGDDTAEHSPDRLLDRGGPDDLRFVLVEGDDEHPGPEDGGVRGEAERFAGLLEDRGMTVATDHPDGGHDFETWKSSVPTAVDFLAAGWAASP
ncbi:esterase [Nocardiopsis sp. HNM0947]|uniref:Esterase n=1 Tax=Nocardiopsis coralli TaxID=2772213 RepID=A0ABR9P4I4_9ACTN|nr:alpha/beta hydrolase-fold protein [Nocardiopsis coralli]MBE2998754.1 esterase [Nocardiopsis coralli]